MAVEASDEPNLPHDFGDDDGPVTFKRYTSSKKKQLHSESTKSTSNNRDGQSNTVEASDKPNLPHDFGDDDGPVTFKRYTSSKKKQLHSESTKSTSNNRDGQSNTVEASDKPNLPHDFGDDDGPVTFKRYTSSKKKQLHSESTKSTSNNRDGQSNTVEASDKPNLPHDFGNDDGPVSFKQYTSSKKMQLHSELTKSTSNSRDGQSNRQISNAPSSNGQSSSIPKDNVVSSAKASAMKSSVGNSKASNSIVNATSVKLPAANSRSPSLNDKPKPVPEQKMPIDIKGERNIIKHCTKDYAEDSEDEEDTMQKKKDSVKAMREKIIQLLQEVESRKKDNDNELMKERELELEKKEEQFQEVVKKLELSKRDIELLKERKLEVEDREKRLLEEVEYIESINKGYDRRLMEYELKERRFKERVRELDSREEECDELMNTLLSKEKQLEVRFKELESNEKEYEEGTKKLLGLKEKELEERTRELRAKEIELEEQTRELGSKEKKLEEQTRELESKEKQHEEEFECNMKKFLSECEHVNGRVKEQESEKNKFEAQVREHELKEKLYEVRVQELSLKEKKFEIQLKQLESKEKEYEERLKELASKEKQHVAQHSQAPQAVDNESSPTTDGSNLQLLLNEQTNDPELYVNGILVYLKSMSDPAKLVLDVIQKPVIRLDQKGDKGAIIEERHIFLLEQLMRISPDIKSHVREEAMKLALHLKANMGANTENSLVVLAFLLLLSAYGLVSSFDEDEVFKHFEFAAQHRQAVELFRALGFLDKISAKLFRNSNVRTSSGNYDDSDQKKPLSKVQKERQNGSSASNEQEKPSKPLSARLKVNSINDNKATPIVKKSYEDSDDDDDFPLSAKLFRNSNVRTSSGNYDDSDQKKPLSEVQKERQNGSSASNEQEKPSKPLSARLKVNSNNDNKSTPVVVKKSYEDSDDIPLSAKLFRNSNVRTSSGNYDDSYQKKPLSKVQKERQNGSSASNEQEKPSKPLSARLKVNSNNDNKATPVVVKKLYEDSDDDIPLSAKLFRNSNVRTFSGNYDDSDQKKPLSKVQKERQNGSSASNEQEKPSKPLSAMLKVNSINDNKATPVVVKKSYEDSDDDDDFPLSAKLFRNSNVRTSSGNYDDSDQKKPLSKVQKERQNGSSASNEQEKPSTLPAKRPLDNSNSVHSSAKKSKVSDPAAFIKTKQVSVKCEPKVDDDDDDDDIPTSQRIKRPPTSADKSSSIKKNLTKVTKVNKAGKTSFKKQPKKLKKSGKGSDYSKSTKLLPSSGDGQKKWTTLVHNGVIFPPPYQPHGVKMLYKGKPVDLTPEQEEE